MSRTLSRRNAAMLLHHALGHLFYTSPDAATANADPDDYLGCCPLCCAPCVVLADLLRKGDLDQLVAAWRPDSLPGTAWWDTENDRVDRAWLTRAWSQTERLGCAQTHTKDVRLFLP